VRRFGYLVQAVRRAGPQKLLFGSDGPWLHPALELYKIRLLGLPARDEALILGGNVARLLGLGASPSMSPPPGVRNATPARYNRAAGRNAGLTCRNC
jgi:hypothetical protein